MWLENNYRDKNFFPPVSRLAIDVLNLASFDGSLATINNLLCIWAIWGFGQDDLHKLTKLLKSMQCPYLPSVSYYNSNYKYFPFPPHPRNIINILNVCPNNILANNCFKKSIQSSAISIRIATNRFSFSISLLFLTIS